MKYILSSAATGVFY